jgi:hypothetical protein
LIFTLLFVVIDNFELGAMDPPIGPLLLLLLTELLLLATAAAATNWFSLDNFAGFKSFSKFPKY